MIRVILKESKLLNEVSKEEAIGTLGSKFEKSIYNAVKSDEANQGLTPQTDAYYQQKIANVKKNIVALIPKDIKDDEAGQAILWLKRVFAAPENSQLRADTISTIAANKKTIEKYFMYKNTPNLLTPEEKNLFSFSSIQQLESLLAAKKKAYNKYNAEKKAKEIRTMFVGETDKYKIVIPENQAASCHFGAGTTWCTAARGDSNYFNDYHRKYDPLFIFISKSDPTEKYQISLFQAQFKDKDDDDIEASMLIELLSALIEVGLNKKYPKIDMVYRKVTLSYNLHFDLLTDGELDIANDLSDFEMEHDDDGSSQNLGAAEPLSSHIYTLTDEKSNPWISVRAIADPPFDKVKIKYDLGYNGPNPNGILEKSQDEVTEMMMDRIRDVWSKISSLDGSTLLDMPVDRPDFYPDLQRSKSKIYYDPKSYVFRMNFETILKIENFDNPNFKEIKIILNNFANDIGKLFKRA